MAMFANAIIFIIASANIAAIIATASTFSFIVLNSPPYADSLLLESNLSYIDFPLLYSYPVSTGHCHA